MNSSSICLWHAQQNISVTVEHAKTSVCATDFSCQTGEFSQADHSVGLSFAKIVQIGDFRFAVHGVCDWLQPAGMGPMHPSFRADR